MSEAATVDVSGWSLDRLRASITAAPPDVGQAVRYYLSEDDPLRRDRSTAYLDLASLQEYERDPDPAALARLVGQRSWFHTIELPGGLVTGGLYDHRPLVADYCLPPDLSGRSVLDVATYDGFWAFEFERRGGAVTAVDLPTRLERDWPGPVRDALREHDLDGPLGTGFRLARKARGSGVELVERNVYALAELGREFDFVHVADLLVHLERPLEALRQVRAVTKGAAHIVEQFSPKLDPGAHTIAYYGGWNYTTWFVPSLSALVQQCYDAGFQEVELLGVHTLQPNADVAGQPRAILRAS